VKSSDNAASYRGRTVHLALTRGESFCCVCVFCKRLVACIVECFCCIPWMILVCKFVKDGCGIESPGGQIFLRSLYTLQTCFYSLSWYKPALCHVRRDLHISSRVIIFLYHDEGIRPSCGTRYMDLRPAPLLSFSPEFPARGGIMQDSFGLAAQDMEHLVRFIA
jgi:hypothetical protein